MLEKAARAARGAMLRVASNEALYLFLAFLLQSFLGIDPFKWHRETVDALWSTLVVPWGAALCLLRLERRERLGDGEKRRDLAALFALLLWIVVPFAYRFGLTENNVVCWYNHAVVFFGVYAYVTEQEPERRDRLLDLLSALFATLCVAVALPALYCAWGARALYAEPGDYPFGIGADGSLYLGLYYNNSALQSMCCALFAFIGFGRRKHPLARLAHLAPALMMALVVVLTQSRTSRYAILAALALGAWGAVFGAKRPARQAARLALACAAAFAVLVGGYAATRTITNAALSHYARVHAAEAAPAETAGPVEGIAPDEIIEPAEPEEPAETGESAEEDAIAESDASAGTDVPAETVEPVKQREGFDFSFQNRTAIWKAMLGLWAKEPKKLLIGYGMGNAGPRIAQYAQLEDFPLTVEAHNTYLQFIANLGLIGFALLTAFLFMQLPAFWQGLTAPARRGDRALCMFVTAALIFGTMESHTLGAMQPINLLLFYSLALLRAHDREAREREKAA